MVRILLLSLVAFPLFSLSASASDLSSVRDSVGVERRNGKSFVQHKVEPKETLYALSRKYGVPVSQIVESNPNVETSIMIGQIVLVPRKATIAVSSSVTPAAKPAPATVATPAPVASNRTFTVNERGEKLHTIEPKQTLYSLSRMYAVTVDDIKRWNNLTTNNIEIGTQLIVGKGATTTASKKPIYVPEADDEVAKPATAATTAGSTTNSDATVTTAVFESSKPGAATVNEREESTTSDEPVSGVKKIAESGMAEMIDPKADTNKYLALHKTAPIGTIMQVKNAMNGQVVYVRVIGKLPETGANNNVVVKISKKAYQKLGAVDQRFRVDLSYMP
jgi:LysM repeat protein